MTHVPVRRTPHSSTNDGGTIFLAEIGDMGFSPGGMALTASMLEVRMPAPATLRVLGIAGSLRRGSYNRALLRAAVELAPAAMHIEVYEGLGDIPLYNADVEAQGDPAPVAALKESIAAADALLVVTPEYNYGVPGVLKNAIDWASRPAGRSPLNGKPAAILGASPGNLGTARAQLALRQSFLFTATYVLPKPEVLVARAHEKIDAEGRLHDEPTRQNVRKLLEALVEWSARFQPRS